MCIFSWLKSIDEFQTHPSKVGVFVGFSSGSNMHCGILFKDSNSLNSFNALHLAWHSVLNLEKDSKNISEYYWIVPSIDIERIVAISAVCRKVFRRNRDDGLPYGLMYQKSKIDKDGTLLLADGEHGLTCSTFVLAVFEEARINLIDIGSWGPRNEDIEWHSEIVQFLKVTQDRYKISDDHIKNVEGEIGCSRFRPEEVAASTRFRINPGRTEEVRTIGARIRGSIQS